jgi:hypothetical protein
MKLKPFLPASRPWAFHITISGRYDERQADIAAIGRLA